MDSGLTESEKKTMKREFDRLEKERKEIVMSFKIIEKKDVSLSKRGKNDYDRLFKEVKKVVMNKEKEKKSWIVEMKEAELYRILGSKGRTHISSKFGLSTQIQKEMTELFKKDVYCSFTSTKNVYYLSSYKVK